MAFFKNDSTEKTVTLKSKPTTGNRFGNTVAIIKLRDISEARQDGRGGVIIVAHGVTYNCSADVLSEL